MKFPALLLALSLPLLSTTTRADDAKQPLVVEAPAGWKVEHKIPGGAGSDFYTLTKAEEHGLLMFYRWSAPGTKEQLPQFLDMIIKGFTTEVAKSDKIKLKDQKPERMKIEGGDFSGEAAVFAMEGDIYQTMFMAECGGSLWTGQFTGSRELWEEAVKILKAVKKNAP